MELTKLASEHDKLKCDMEQIKCELNVMEQYSRHNCVSIFGIPENAGQNIDLVIKYLSHDKLGWI